MYHRFEENKYPSTNIRINDFQESLEMIKKVVLNLSIPLILKKNLINNKKQRKLLLTIDDGYQSFYDNAWPILKDLKSLLFYL